MAESKPLSGKRVAILVTQDFEQAELTGPRQALEEAGATTQIVSLEPGQVQGFNHDTKADSFPVDLTFDQASPKDFDGVLLPGGAINADKLRIERKAQEFVRSIDGEGKPVAVICHAPWLLVSAGLVKGRTLTSFPTIQDDIRNAGGTWQDQEVLRDGNWVSSRKPDDIPAFNREMIKLFSESQTNGRMASSAQPTINEQAYTSESMLGGNNPGQQSQQTEQTYRGPDDLLIHDGPSMNPNQ